MLFFSFELFHNKLSSKFIGIECKNDIVLIHSFSLFDLQKERKEKEKLSLMKRLTKSKKSRSSPPMVEGESQDADVTHQRSGQCVCACMCVCACVRVPVYSVIRRSQLRSCKSLNSFNAGDVILRPRRRHCFTAGHIIFHNSQVPFALSQHRDRANIANVSSEWENRTIEIRGVTNVCVCVCVCQSSQ